MSSTSPSLPSSSSASAYTPLSGQHISAIERDLVAVPFSVLTRSRQDRLLMVSFVSILLSVGAVTITKDSFSLLGIPLHSEADAAYVKNIAIAVVLVFLVMFVVSVWQDFFARRALKPAIQGRLDDTASALDADDPSAARMNELLSMIDKHIKLAQQPNLTQRRGLGNCRKINAKSLSTWQRLELRARYKRKSTATRKATSHIWVKPLHTTVR